MEKKGMRPKPQSESSITLPLKPITKKQFEDAVKELKGFEDASQELKETSKPKRAAA